MHRSVFFMVTCMGLILILGGCAGPSRVEMDYGTSFHLSKFNQILNPEAEKNLEPVTGLDGKAAEASVEKYQKDFEKPAQTTTISLFGIGTGAGKK